MQNVYKGFSHQFQVLFKAYSGPESVYVIQSPVCNHITVAPLWGMSLIAAAQCSPIFLLYMWLQIIQRLIHCVSFDNGTVLGTHSEEELCDNYRGRDA